MKTKANFKTKTLVECAILLAAATMLSFFPKIDGIWANGGSITICSMLPIIVIGYRHGFKWGLLTGFAFSILQLFTGGFYPAGTTLAAAFFTLLLDYILPYTVIGFGGIFRDKFKNKSGELVLGSIVVLTARYFFHLISGYVLWMSLETASEYLATPGFTLGEWAIGSFNGKSLFMAYNVIYNASYMLPEIIITAIGAFLIGRLLKNKNI